MNPVPLTGRELDPAVRGFIEGRFAGLVSWGEV